MPVGRLCPLFVDLRGAVGLFQPVSGTIVIATPGRSAGLISSSVDWRRALAEQRGIETRWAAGRSSMDRSVEAAQRERDIVSFAAYSV